MIGTSNQGAKIYYPGLGTYVDFLQYNKDKTEIFVRSFIQVSADEYWVGTESGIFIYSLKNGLTTNLKKSFNDPYALSDNAVYSFCKDKEGGIWAGTYFGGVNYYPHLHTSFKKFFPKVGQNSLSGNVVREIHEDKNGNLWIGTEDAGVNKYDTATRQFTNYSPTGKRNSISYTNIHGLLVDDDKLWIGTFEHGLDVMDIATGNVTHHYTAGPGPNDLKSNFIFSIIKTKENEVLLGTTRGAFIYNRQQNNFRPIPNLPTNNWYSSLLVDSEGTIWGSTYGNGINFYNTILQKSGNFSFGVSKPNSIASNRVNAIFEDADKNLWFATEGGLCKFNRSTNDFTRYTTRNGLPSNFVLNMLQDDKKNLWLSTTQGLVLFDPRSEKTKVFTTVNGLLNDQFNFNSAYKNKEGRMFFGSVKGMISFKPGEFVMDTYVPPVYITGLQVFNTDIGIGQKGSPLKKAILYSNQITLTHDQSTISIDFAALSFTAPEMAEYAYRLDGLDRSWTILKQNRRAYFTKLAPGTYVFRVKATNSSGMWNEKETLLTIEILPPWWKSRLAYGFYILVGLIGVYAVIMWYHNRQTETNLRRFQLLETAKEREIYEAKMDFFTNVAHEIKTPLTLIKAPLEKVIRKWVGNADVSNYLKIMERNTDRLIDLTSQLLDFSQTEIYGYSLHFSKANITELLEDAYNSFTPLAEQKNLKFTLSLPPCEQLAFIDTDAFNKILFNLINNAVKYADSMVSVILVATNRSNTFSIEVVNDGYQIPAEMGTKIFEPFVRLKATEKQQGTGIGLALSQSLVQLHKGTLVLSPSTDGKNHFLLSLPVTQQGRGTTTTTTVLDSNKTLKKSL